MRQWGQCDSKRGVATLFRNVTSEVGSSLTALWVVCFKWLSCKVGGALVRMQGLNLCSDAYCCMVLV